MAAAEVWYTGNSMLLRVSGLENAANGNPINDATVTATLVDSVGTQVAGESWPLTLAYVASSDGVYEGTASSDVEVVAQRTYTLQVTATKAGVGTGYWELPVRAQARTE